MGVSCGCPAALRDSAPALDAGLEITGIGVHGRCPVRGRHRRAEAPGRCAWRWTISALATRRWPTRRFPFDTLKIRSGLRQRSAAAPTPRPSSPRSPVRRHAGHAHHRRRWRPRSNWRRYAGRLPGGARPPGLQPRPADEFLTLRRTGAGRHRWRRCTRSTQAGSPATQRPTVGLVGASPRGPLRRCLMDFEHLQPRDRRPPGRALNRPRCAMRCRRR